MITVKYFASLRSISGKDEDQFSLGSETTLKKLCNEISKTAPEIGDMILSNKIVISVNLNVVSLDTIIKDGDEVALLPPFSGGN